MAERRWTRRLPWLAALALLLALPLAVNNYVQFVVNTMLVYSLAAIGFNVVIGYLGQLAFANAAFFGIGAYAAGLSMAHLGLPYPLALAVCAAVGGLAGVVVGLPALRVRGYYLAIVTLAFGELMRWIYVHADGLTYGASGFNVPQVALFGRAMNETGKYYVFLFVVLLGLGTTRCLVKSRIGRAFVAVRNNEAAAASTGVAVLRIKVVAFAWSGLVVGLAGGLYALLNGRVSPDTFGLSQMLMHFAIVMIGGLGSLAGSIVGAVLLTGAPELLRNFPGLEEIVFSLLLMAVLFLMPRGIGGLIADRIPGARERLYQE
ncbi:hypothetical protein CAL29_22655 [Bordetella genomosp. 10]|uniref:Branched-chain amino acid ABC transporter permease n=1 Tax=Bordetella genomosp. 10 TaxID=1416804 RepID=A0A261S0A9_9BORD|nr:branched-chain amino acid ABC transporter permease [Bordetella genomosp. 10]OZI30786.1 hypothetical protein CAL29_22655 [Bordetella genomosp. 10]